MTICRKCGNPIADGEELCQACLAKENSAGVDLMAQLAQMNASASSGMSAIEAVKAKAAARPKPAPAPEPSIPEPAPAPVESTEEIPVAEPAAAVSGIERLAAAKTAVKAEEPEEAPMPEPEIEDMPQVEDIPEIEDISDVEDIPEIEELPNIEESTEEEILPDDDFEIDEELSELLEIVGGDDSTAPGSELQAAIAAEKAQQTESAVAEGAAEETMIDEPAVEEPAVEESIVEEPVAEEPAIEEPTEEPEEEFDPNKQLSPDEIAAMFAGAESAAEESAEEPAEEPTEEEVPEEPSEEPTVEEAEEEFDPNKQLSPDEIAALFGAAESDSAEETPEEEFDPNKQLNPDEIAALFGAAEEASSTEESEPEVESDEVEDEPLPELDDIEIAPDEEIMPDVSEEEEAEDIPMPELEAEAEAEEPIDPDEEDDINKLLEMLDDNYVEEPEPNFDDEEEDEEEEEEAVDYHVDPDELFSSDDSDAIFADELEDEPVVEEEETDAFVEPEDDFEVDLTPEPDEDELPVADDVAAMEQVDDLFALMDDVSEEGPSGDEASDVDAVLDALGEDEEGVDTVDLANPVKVKKVKRKKPKQKGGFGIFMKKIFGNVITEETAEIEAKEREMEELDKEEKVKLKAEKKELEAAQKEEKAAAAAAEKEQKAADKAAAAAEKAAAKEEKKKKKQEAAAMEVVGKLNPIGTSIVVIMFGAICVAVILGSKSFSYRSALLRANDSFDHGEYEEAYDSIKGVEMSEDDKVTEEKVRICMELQKELNSYDNYYTMGLYLESLDSLMKGIRSYDKNREKADKLEILGQLNALEGQLAGTLYSEFGINETEARELNDLEDRREYTRQLQDIIEAWKKKIKADER
ncbi:MAG: hypothetical protein K5639_03965 [Eubacterium sp.]|nr:hypothetical protein [Eubacterium sp.]